MRSIKNYIENSLNESLLDDDDVFYDPKKEIDDWIRDNYKITGELTISDDLVVDCSGGVTVYNKSIESLTNGLFRWGKIKMYFDCGDCKNLKSLEGAPKKVGGYFDCGYCENLISLEGAPKEVGSHFICAFCENLKSLEGAPKKVNKKFYCMGCKKLKIADSDYEKYKIEDQE